MATAVQGLAPYLPPSRPRANARWWAAGGDLKGKRLVVARLEERAAAPEVQAACGLAAPCSLPRAFVEFLDGRRPALADARRFASRRPHGRKHPLRSDHESMSALDARRLVLHLAARPLLAEIPTLPWAEAKPPFLFEVDPPAFLHALELPCARLAGARPEAVARRARILDALYEGVLGFAVELKLRDYAIASHHALAAVLGAAAAAWLLEAKPEPPSADAEAWIPVP